MSFEHKEGYGAIFKNTKKKSEKEPEYRGSIMLDGKVWEIAGWVKNNGKGPFLSLKGQEPREQREERPTQRGSKPDHFEERDDAIPF